MEIVIKTTDKEAGDILRGYVPMLRKMFRKLSQSYKFKLPERVILRPLRKNNAPRKSIWTFGRAGYSPETGWYISMNIQLCQALGKECDTLAHEVAHIGEARKTGRWTHGELWEKMYTKIKAMCGTTEHPHIR